MVVEAEQQSQWVGSTEDQAAGPHGITVMLKKWGNVEDAGVGAVHVEIAQLHGAPHSGTDTAQRSYRSKSAVGPAQPARPGPPHAPTGPVGAHCSQA